MEQLITVEMYLNHHYNNIRAALEAAHKSLSIYQNAKNKDEQESQRRLKSLEYVIAKLKKAATDGYLVLDNGSFHPLVDLGNGELVVGPASS